MYKGLLEVVGQTLEAPGTEGLDKKKKNSLRNP